MRRQLAQPVVISQRPSFKTTDLLVWLLLFLPLAQSLLFWTIPNPSVDWVAPIRFLRPIAALGAGLLFLTAAAREIGLRRWAWCCFALMQGIHTIASVLTHIFPDLRSGAAIGYGSLILTLSFAMYGAALIGAALYLYQYERWLGNAARVVLDALALALALLVLLQSVLPRLLGVEQIDTAIADALPYLAADGGALFAVLVVALRYSRTHQPLVIMVALGLACLIAADAIDAWLTVSAGGAQWRFATSPLYVLQGVLMAIGAYWSVSRAPTGVRSTKASTAEWWLWTLSPTAVALVALATAALTRSGGRAVLSVLCLVALLQVILALRALREVETSLETALGREQEARSVIQFFQHELRGYADGLRGIALLLRQQLASRPNQVEQKTHCTIHVLSATVEQLDELIQQLVLLGRAANPIAVRRERVVLQPLANEVLEIAVEQTSSRVRGRAEVDGEIAVRGDPLLLRLALRTAISNSVEAIARASAGRNAEITVRARVDGDRVQVRIEDTGPGFSSAVVLAHASGRLSELRSVTATRVRGIGLALLEQIAALHEEGTLRLGNNEAAAGAWVQLDLPRWSDDTPLTASSDLSDSTIPTS